MRAPESHGRRLKKEFDMSKLVYRIVRHDGAWAHEVNGTFSEPFRTREQARAAARLAAREHGAPGEPTPIDYEDAPGSGTRKSPSERTKLTRW